MRLPLIFNFNSIIMILIGVGCLYAAYNSSDRVFSFGLFGIGVGNILLGVTHGFSDRTLRGRTLFRIGALAYAFGIPVLAYWMFNILVK